MYTSNPKLHPAILAGTPKLESVSDKYSFVPSGPYVDIVENMGWTLDKVQGGSEYGRHLMTFSNPDHTLANGDKLTILTRNAHDGSSMFVNTLGFFRLVCTNGLMVGTAFESYNVRHVGFTQVKVEESINKLLEQAPKLIDSISRFNSIEPTADQTAAFLVEASKLRDISQPIQLNFSRREADNSNTLWTLLNRVQENLIQGGYISSTGRSARSLKAVDKQVKINQALWNIAEKLAA